MFYSAGLPADWLAFSHQAQIDHQPSRAASLLFLVRILNPCYRVQDVGNRMLRPVGSRHVLVCESLVKFFGL
jgi:hypothetical protein